MKIKNCPVVNVVRLHDVHHGIQSWSVVLSHNLWFDSSLKVTVLAAAQLFIEDNSSDAADVSNNDGFKERFHITSPSRMFQIPIGPGQSIFESNRY
jgi:hypothetical protein